MPSFRFSIRGTAPRPAYPPWGKTCATGSVPHVLDHCGIKPSFLEEITEELKFYHGSRIFREKRYDNVDKMAVITEVHSLKEQQEKKSISQELHLLFRVRSPLRASVSPSSFETLSLNSSLSLRILSNSSSRLFIRSTRLWRHLRAARVFNLRFSTRDESTRVRTSSPCEVAGLDRDVETEPGIWGTGEACECPSDGMLETLFRG